MRFNISEKYTLKLSWDKAIYNNTGECLLVNAKFSGPALSIANKINSHEHINLDFYNQYLIFVTNVYIGKFSWGEVVYNKDNTVALFNAMLTHDSELNNVPKLKNTDFILIDTSAHEESKHAYSLVYTSYVVNADGVLYDFRS